MAFETPATFLILIWNNARVEAQRAGRVLKFKMVTSFVSRQVAIYGTTATRRAA